MDINVEKAKTALCFLKCLSNSTNKRILYLLEQEKELDTDRIAKEIRVTNNFVSHYLIDMRNKGILVSRREDRSILYSLNLNFHKKLLGIIDEIFTTGNSSMEKQ